MPTFDDIAAPSPPFPFLFESARMPRPEARDSSLDVNEEGYPPGDSILNCPVQIFLNILRFLGNAAPLRRSTGYHWYGNDFQPHIEWYGSSPRKCRLHRWNTHGGVKILIESPGRIFSKSIFFSPFIKRNCLDRAGPDASDARRTFLLVNDCQFGDRVHSCYAQKVAGLKDLLTRISCRFGFQRALDPHAKVNEKIVGFVLVR